MTEVGHRTCLVTTFNLMIVEELNCLLYNFFYNEYYNIKMILEGIITHLRTNLGCLKPEMVVCCTSMRGLQTVIEGFKERKEVLKQDDNANQNYFIIVNNT